MGTSETKRFDRLEWQREMRKATGNAHTKKYEKTKNGKLMRTYRNMYTRVSGILKTKAHLYEGLDILSKDDFYEWSLSNDAFNTLFDEWVSSGYDKKLSPSIDRKDTNYGYVLGNIRWLTHSENSRLGAVSKGNSNG